MNSIYRLSILIAIILLPISSQGQEFVEDILEKLEIQLNERKVAEDSTRYPAKLVISPVISYEPATSLGFGVGAKILFKFKGSGPETRTSNLPISALYTLNNQVIFSSGYTIFFNQEKWYLTGNLLYSKFPQSYYGIGNRSLEKDEEIFTFTNYLIEPLLLKKVVDKLFIGGGFRYNFVTDTELEEEGSLIREMPTGFDGSTSGGVELAVVWDSRDNVLNAQKGSFVQFKQGFYQKALGGSQDFRFNEFDGRTYFQPWKKKEDVFALQLFGRFSWGDVPLAEQSLFGGAESSRGYREGRYRDLNVISLQMEYRWQVWDRIGAVAFVGAGDVFNDFNELDGTNIKYSAGMGLRLKIVKEENLNIRIDYGFGFGHEFANNFFLGIAEAF